jgi:hypothetical protein
MLRVRFHANIEDPRPINWPIKHPYWVSGEGEDYAIVIAYADDLDYIVKNWPEATGIDAEERTEYTFTDRFPRPDWFKGE